MGRPIRIAGSLAGAILVTASLFWLMQSLVHDRSGEFHRPGPTPVIQFRQVKPTPPPDEPERRQPPEPERMEEPPPPPELTVPDNVRPTPRALHMAYDVTLPLKGTGPALSLGNGVAGQGSGPLVPMLRIQPLYPYRAALAGIEGWVRVEFTVTETGAVVEPRVVRSKPSDLFDEAALKAISRWRFEPRRVDGRAVPARAAQTFDFHLAES